MQNVNFRSVAEFLGYLPDAELELVTQLRDLILENIPDVTEKLSYNVPYYFRHSRICFIWPASVPWGKVQRNGVLLGLCNGQLLQDHHYFNMNDRKRVASKTFFTPKEIDEDLLLSYLFEATEIDNNLKMSKQQK
jgi:hypothetical protein